MESKTEGKRGVVFFILHSYTSLVALLTVPISGKPKERACFSLLQAMAASQGGLEENIPPPVVSRTNILALQKSKRIGVRDLLQHLILLYYIQ